MSAAAAGIILCWGGGSCHTAGEGGSAWFGSVAPVLSHLHSLGSPLFMFWYILGNCVNPEVESTIEVNGWGINPLYVTDLG